MIKVLSLLLYYFFKWQDQKTNPNTRQPIITTVHEAIDIWLEGNLNQKLMNTNLVYEAVIFRI